MKWRCHLLSSTFIWKGTWGQNSGTYLHLVGAALEDDDAETIMVLLLLTFFSTVTFFIIDFWSILQGNIHAGLWAQEAHEPSIFIYNNKMFVGPINKGINEWNRLHAFCTQVEKFFDSNFCLHIQRDVQIFVLEINKKKNWF